MCEEGMTIFKVIIEELFEIIFWFVFVWEDSPACIFSHILSQKGKRIEVRWLKKLV